MQASFCIVKYNVDRLIIYIYIRKKAVTEHSWKESDQETSKRKCPKHLNSNVLLFLFSPASSFSCCLFSAVAGLCYFGVQTYILFFSSHSPICQRICSQQILSLIYLFNEFSILHFFALSVLNLIFPYRLLS